jgi:tRNA (pseudouridine54-N1)-methyltransferase
MREFIVYSATASTAPVIKDLKSAGRIDILLHSIVSALFASNEMRPDVKLHLILMGPPNAPRHITLQYHEDNTISKKDMKKLIEMSLRKCRVGQVRDVHPGVTVDDKKIDVIVEEAKKDNKTVFVLDAYGDQMKELVKEKKNFNYPVFILGDHDGFDKQTKKYLKKNTQRTSLGPQMYLTSQAITILNYELDNL